MTKHPVNITFAQLNDNVEPANIGGVAIESRIPGSMPGLNNNLTNVLDSTSSHLIDMTRNYSTFANQRVTATPHIMRAAEDRKGQSKCKDPAAGKRTFRKETVDQLNCVLQSMTESDRTGSTAGTLGRPVANKMRTSLGLWSVWSIGYVPRMAAIVDVYQVGMDGKEEVLAPFGRYYYGIGGGSLPAEI